MDKKGIDSIRDFGSYDRFICGTLQRRYWEYIRIEAKFHTEYSIDYIDGMRYAFATIFNVYPDYSSDTLRALLYDPEGQAEFSKGEENFRQKFIKDFLDHKKTAADIVKKIEKGEKV